MERFLFEVTVQAFVIALIWVLVSRDAARQRAMRGTPPASVSAFAWGALCGLTWIALIPYIVSRRRAAEGAAPRPERNLQGWWVVLTVASVVWAATDFAGDDTNNGAQHALLSVTFAVCALIAWSRDRKAAKVAV